MAGLGSRVPWALRAPLPLDAGFASRSGRSGVLLEL